MSDASAVRGRLAVIGIGEDGWAGLGEPARAALRSARHLIGSERQLGLLPDDLTAEREPWPRPFLARVDELAAAINGGDDPAGWTVLASGDPMLHGVGSTLAQRIDPALLHVIPAPSAFALACARLGWATDATPLISRVKDPEQPVAARLRKAGRAVIYVPGTEGSATVARLLTADGLGDARLVVMERLGGPHERLVETTAATWNQDADALHLVAVELAVSAAEARHLGAASEVDPALATRIESTVPGLPDHAYVGDGQLTRAEVRAVVLAALAPREGELLWDVGAGSGTIAIEWCRAAAATRAVAIERRADRAATIATNAARLGVDAAASLGAAGVAVVTAAIDDALASGLPTPDAIFVGGGGTTAVLDRCWDAVRPGGRVVANAVTLEGESALAAAAGRHGGHLIRLEFSRAEPLGTFTGWKPQRPIVQWSATKEPHPA